MSLILRKGEARVTLLRERELAQFDLLHGLLNQPVDVQSGLGPADLFQVRLGRWVRRREEPAAVLVRLDRSLVGADLLRLLGDLHLVHADQRAQKGQRRRLIHHRQVAGGLRGDLPQTVT